MSSLNNHRSILPAMLVAAVALAALISPAAHAAPETGAATPRGNGSCDAPGGTRLKPAGATLNAEYTKAFREFGNSGGGWENQGGWAASDGVYSVELADRSVAWLMNDTFLGPVTNEQIGTDAKFLHGTVVLGGRDGLPDTTVTAGTQEMPESIVSPPDEVNGNPWYWNEDGIIDGGKLRVFQARTGLNDDAPPWNFGWLGTDIVTYSKDFAVEAITPSYGTPGGVHWGVELLELEGKIYVYGQKDGSAYVARAAKGHLVDGAWEFYAAGAWVAEQSAATPMAANVGASYSVTRVRDTYVLTTTTTFGPFAEHTVEAAVSSTPTGPFTDRTVVYTAPEGEVTNIVAPYNVAAHPSISDPGELVVSYNVNSEVHADVLANANAYRPRFLTIEFESCGPPSPTPSATPSVTPTASPSVPPTPTPASSTSPMPSPSQTTTMTSPSPSWSMSDGAPSGGQTDLYSTPGLHHVNGRWWFTQCEDYSRTTRCRTEIWAVQMSWTGGKLMKQSGWFFNNLTYLPYMKREQWAGNPLGFTGAWTSADGRMWRTECDTPRTGGNGCRSSIWTRTVVASQTPGGGYSYTMEWTWVVNNIVRFR